MERQDIQAYPTTHSNTTASPAPLLYTSATMMSFKAILIAALAAVAVHGAPRAADISGDGESRCPLPR